MRRPLHEKPEVYCRVCDGKAGFRKFNKRKSYTVSLEWLEEKERKQFVKISERMMSWHEGKRAEEFTYETLLRLLSRVMRDLKLPLVPKDNGDENIVLIPEYRLGGLKFEPLLNSAKRKNRRLRILYGEALEGRDVRVHKVTEWGFVGFTEHGYRNFTWRRLHHVRVLPQRPSREPKERQFSVAYESFERDWRLKYISEQGCTLYHRNFLLAVPAGTTRQQFFEMDHYEPSYYSRYF